MDAASAAVSSPPATMRFVIFPWLALGHLLPFLELAERLASRGHHVSLVSMPDNIARLPAPRSRVDLVALPLPPVDLVALPLPPVEGLPDGAEATDSVPHEKHELLFKAFAEFLGTACSDEGKRRPDWVIVDSYFCAAAATAAAVNHQVPRTMLLLASAATLLAQA